MTSPVRAERPPGPSWRSRWHQIATVHCHHCLKFKSADFSGEALCPCGLLISARISGRSAQGLLLPCMAAFPGTLRVTAPRFLAGGVTSGLVV
jgi:hypothetical protein